MADLTPPPTKDTKMENHREELSPNPLTPGGKKDHCRNAGTFPSGLFGGGGVCVSEYINKYTFRGTEIICVY